MTTRPVVHHIPVCPFSQRLEILLNLKGQRGAVDFRVVDITRPRAPELLARTRGSTALPVLELPDGRILKESLVLMQYFEAVFPEPRVAQADPYRRAVEQMMSGMEADFGNQGYRFVMNQDPAQRDALHQGMLKVYARLNDFLLEHSAHGQFLFEQFGWAECVFTPLMMRFWFLDYYESFELPAGAQYDRVRVWRDACLAHPAAQQVTREQIVKVYYDYARGAGNGALPAGRKTSSFTFIPDWSQRPWPPRGKYGLAASDAELGL